MLLKIVADKMEADTKIYDYKLKVSIVVKRKIKEKTGDDTRQYYIKVHPYMSLVFMNLMENSSTYRQSTINYWTQNLQENVHLYLYPCLQTPPFLDVKSCSLATLLLWKVIEQEDALHWLSTLGGAFSNLGESNQQFAERAGRNAFKQMMLGSRCGDLAVVAKCRLFVAHADLQLGRLRSAARLVRSVWRLCHQQPLAGLAITSKLITMCQGVWSRVK